MAKLTLSDLANLSNETSTVTTINNNNTAIESALENTLSRDGTSPNEMESNLDMNGYRVINAAAPVDDNDLVRRVDIESIYVDVTQGPTGPTPWSVPVAWASSTAYVIGPPASAVTYQGETYVCTTAHTSTGSFDSSKFVKVSSKGADGLGQAAIVATRTDLKALDTASRTVAYLTEAGREGTWLWKTGNYSTQITADTLEGVYAKADAIAASSGAWVREISGDVSIHWWGADPTYVADSAPAIKAARDYLQTSSDYRGGQIYIPAGRYKVNSTIAFNSYNSVHNIFIVGDGELNTTLDFSGQTAGTDGITFDKGAHFGISDLMITGSKRNGISIMPGETIGGANYALLFRLENLRIQNCVNNGIAMRQCYMGSLRDIWSTGNAGGIVFNGYHTSINMERCYALGCTTGTGISLNGMIYSTLDSCASDQNRWGFALSNLRGVAINSCGAESNGRDGWIVLSSNSSATGIPSESQNIDSVNLNNCFAFHNCTEAVASYANFVYILTADSRPIKLKLNNCSSYYTNVADSSIIANGASGLATVIESDPKYDSSVTASGSVQWEGRWLAFTPVIAGTSTAGTGTYTTQVGKYMVQDGICYFSIDLTWTAHTGTGGMKISGLPFTSISASNTPVNLRYSNLTYTSPPFGFVDASNTIVTLAVAPSGSAIAFLDIDTAATIGVSGFYKIA